MDVCAAKANETLACDVEHLWIASQAPGNGAVHLEAASGGDVVVQRQSVARRSSTTLDSDTPLTA